MASDFVRKKAAEEAARVDREYGRNAYGGTKWRTKTVLEREVEKQAQEKASRSSVRSDVRESRQGRRSPTSPSISKPKKETKSTQSQMREARKQAFKPESGKKRQSFSSRLGSFLSGTLKNITSDYGNTATTLYQAGQKPRSAMNQDLLEHSQGALKQAQRDLDMMLADNRKKPGTWKKSAIDAQRRVVEDAQRKTGAMKQASGVQKKAVRASQDAMDRVKESAAKDLSKAKEGLGKIGSFAVDVTSAGLGMAADVGAGKIAGVSALLPMAARSFGGGAQEARQGGASLGQQVAYGLGSGALSVATEKIANVAAPFKSMYGSGVLDKTIGKVTKRLGDSKAGQAALSALSEGGEEFVESVFQPVLQKATWNPNARFNLEEAMYDAAIGTTLGGLGGVTGQIGTRRTETPQEAPQTSPALPVREPDTSSAEVAEKPSAAPVRPPVQPSVQSAEPAPPRAPSVQPVPPVEPMAPKASSDITSEILSSNKRVPQEKLSPEQFDEMDMRGDMAMDAAGNQSAERGHGLDDIDADGPEGAESPAEKRGPIRDIIENWYPEQGTEKEKEEYKEDVIEALKRIACFVKRKEAGKPYCFDNMRSSYGSSRASDDAPYQAHGATLLYDYAFVNDPESYMDELNQLLDKMSKNLDGLGAADRGTLNTAYDALQAQSSEFYPEGANSARPVDVPTTGFDGRPISKSAATVMGAEAIPDEVVADIQQMVADGGFSYDRFTDRKAIDRADSTIRTYGFDASLERFRQDVRAGKSGKEIVVLGQKLLNNAANARDGKALAEILSLYSTLNTNAGQAMQALSIFRKMSPENQLYGVQRIVDNLNSSNQKNRTTSKDFDTANIPPELIDKFLSQEDQAGRDAVMEEIYQSVADQIPATWRDKWNTWRYLAMLGNPRTHIRNIVGNLGFQPIRFVKNEIAAGLEAALSAAGVKVERTKSFSADPALYQAAWNDYSSMGEVLGGSKYSEDARGQIMDRRTIFHTKPLEAMRKMNSGALEFEDAIFKRITYADSLAGYLKANGVTAEQLQGGEADPGIISRARTYAANEALKATYQDQNAISNKVQELARPMGVVGEALLPFKKTPANILARSLEYSPLGLAKGLTADLVKVQRGTMDLSDALDHIASGVTGTGLFSLGAYLLSQGILTAGAGDDKDDKWAKLLGHQGYAIELPNGTSVTVDWLAPESLPFFMGAEFIQSLGEDGFQVADITTALKSMANPMLELSMLQGVNDLIESVKFAEDAPLQAMVPSLITSYFSQAIPTLFGQLERSGEAERMTTYTEKDSQISKDLQYALGRASSRIPGMDYQQIPFINEWGQRAETGDPLVRAANNLFNPAFVSKVEIDEVEGELQKLRNATGDTGVFPDRAEKTFTVNGEEKNLSADEYMRYATRKGSLSHDMLKNGISSQAYQRMDDAEKADYVSRLYDYSSQVAKSEVSDFEPQEWVRNAETARRDIGVSPAEYIALYQKHGHALMSGPGYDRVKRATKAGMTVDEYAQARVDANLDGKGSITAAEAEAYLRDKPNRADLWDIINTTRAKNRFR